MASQQLMFEFQPIFVICSVLFILASSAADYNVVIVIKEISTWFLQLNLKQFWMFLT